MKLSEYVSKNFTGSAVNKRKGQETRELVLEAFRNCIANKCGADVTRNYIYDCYCSQCEAKGKKPASRNTVGRHVASIVAEGMYKERKQLKGRYGQFYVYEKIAVT